MQVEVGKAYNISGQRYLCAGIHSADSTFIADMDSNGWRRAYSVGNVKHLTEPEVDEFKPGDVVNVQGIKIELVIPGKDQLVLYKDYKVRRIHGSIGTEKSVDQASSGEA